MRVPRVRMGRGLGLALLMAGLFESAPAFAYPWMIRHDYAGCNQCHADPSGGSLLTAYGRAVGDVTMRTRYGFETEDEPSPRAGFLGGFFELPEEVLLGGDVRGLYYGHGVDGAGFASSWWLMQADVAGQVTIGRFRANGSIGFGQDYGAKAARIVGDDASGSLVSRVFWAGVDIGEDREVLVRAGRMNLPFGLRTVEHEAWVRRHTRTNINADQQLGISVAYNGTGLRGELMGIFGNFQLSPDVFRERGYSAYLEWAPMNTLAVGVSSLITHAGRDVQSQAPTWRHAHGLFARWVPWRPLVLMAELDFLLASQQFPTGTVDAYNATGYAGLFQADYEPLAGVHVMGTAEIHQGDTSKDWPSYGAWLTVSWFFLPHADLRLDLVRQSKAPGTVVQSSTSLIGQIHVFL